LSTEPNNLIEAIRAIQVEQLLTTPSFEKAWPRINDFLLEKVGEFTREDFLCLGDHLSNAFTDKTSDRSQGSVSSAGVVWESLIAWYLNSCLVGTNAVCLKSKKLIPKCVLDSLTVSHANYGRLSEPDLVLISLPSSLNEQVTELTNKKVLSEYSSLCLKHFTSICVINIQCKTNWNDNAQIPMLWNMLYSQAAKSSLTMDNFSIGTTRHSLEQLSDFGYAFVTVPTNDRSKLKTDSSAVFRVATMTAGNYWGHPSKNGVASSIQDFFIRNSARPNFPDNKSIGRLISEQKGYLYFNKS
jgi:hypothetical protein